MIVVNKKKGMLVLGVVMAFSVMFTGCQGGEQTSEVDAKEEVVAVEGTNDEESIHLSEWEGTWNNIIGYFDDEELEEAFEELAKMEDLPVEEAKRNYIEDRKVDFDGLVVEGNKAIFLDGFKDKSGKEIGQMEYEYKEMVVAKHGNFDTEWYAFQALGDGDYEYLLLMPVHGEESLTHFHIRHGNSIEEILAREDWYPTFVKKLKVVQYYYSPYYYLQDV